MKVNLPTPRYKFEDHSTWPPLLPLFFVSQVLNLSPWTLRKWDNNGKLKAVRMGDREDRKYKKEDVVKALSEGIKKSPQKN